jgi:hypothetical protein
MASPFEGVGGSILEVRVHGKGSKRPVRTRQIDVRPLQACRKFPDRALGRSWTQATEMA